jgi:hypothetical protein
MSHVQSNYLDRMLLRSQARAVARISMTSTLALEVNKCCVFEAGFFFASCEY